MTAAEQPSTAGNPAMAGAGRLTASPAGTSPAGTSQAGTSQARSSRRGGSRPRPAGLRLARLYLVSRRVPAALAAIAASAIVLRVMLHWHWDAYGALQLPLIWESGAATVIAATTAGPFGGTESAAGRWLPWLRLGTALVLTMITAGLLAAAGIGADLAGGPLDVLRNVAGFTGIGLLCAALLGGALSWAGPVAYLVIGTYALYGSWHGMPSTTPWVWPARPPHDAGAALCAGLVLAAGLAVVTVRGARDREGPAG